MLSVLHLTGKAWRAPSNGDMQDFWEDLRQATLSILGFFQHNSTVFHLHILSLALGNCLSTAKQIFSSSSSNTVHLQHNVLISSGKELLHSKSPSSWWRSWGLLHATYRTTATVCRHSATMTNQQLKLIWSISQAFSSPSQVTQRTYERVQTHTVFDRLFQLYDVHHECALCFSAISGGQHGANSTLEFIKILWLVMSQLSSQSTQTLLEVPHQMPKCKCTHSINCVDILIEMWITFLQYNTRAGLLWRIWCISTHFRVNCIKGR